MLWWIPSDRPSTSTASPEPLLPRQQPRGRPRGERLQSEGTDDALRRTWSVLRSVLVAVCVVLNIIEAPVHPRHPPVRREERSICPATIFLEKLLEKLLGPRSAGEMGCGILAIGSRS